MAVQKGLRGVRRVHVASSAPGCSFAARLRSPRATPFARAIRHRAAAAHAAAPGGVTTGEMKGERWEMTVRDRALPTFVLFMRRETELAAAAGLVRFEVSRQLALSAPAPQLQCCSLLAPVPRSKKLVAAPVAEASCHIHLSSPLGDHGEARGLGSFGARMREPAGVGGRRGLDADLAVAEDSRTCRRQDGAP